MTQTTPSSVDAMREAKPCQKCGGKGFPRQSGDGDVEWLQCCSCGHEGPLRYSLTEAVAAWNATLPSDGVTIPADGWTRLPAEPTEEMVAAGEAVDGTITARDVYAAMLSAAPKAPPVAQAEGVIDAARFLLDRLVDHEVRMTAEEDAREWHGHVTPAMARLRAALSATTEQGEGE